MNAAVVIRAARKRAGLTQKELALRSATTQSAIAAYESGSKEPSMATLDRLIAAAGWAVAWSLAPARAVVHQTVDAIAQSLHAGDEQEALRLAADLWTGLESMDSADVAAEVETDPGSTGDRRWDALVAGVIERAAHGARVPTPMWTAAKARFLDEWWFLTPYTSLHASALVETPAELSTAGSSSTNRRCGACDIARPGRHPSPPGGAG